MNDGSDINIRIFRMITTGKGSIQYDLDNGLAIDLLIYRRWKGSSLL